MKTTMIMRTIANPRRTTLADLRDADELTAKTRESEPATVAALPSRTANPRRTILMEAPK